MYMIFYNHTSPRPKLTSYVLSSSSSCCFAFFFLVVVRCCNNSRMDIKDQKDELVGGILLWLSGS